jgi:hypothetical protein
MHVYVFQCLNMVVVIADDSMMCVCELVCACVYVCVGVSVSVYNVLCVFDFHRVFYVP